MEAIWDVNPAEQVRLISPIWMVLRYDAGNSREGTAVLMRKLQLVSSNAALVLSLAKEKIVTVGKVERTIFWILEESYKSGNSWFTLYDNESKAILEFINKAISDIQKPKPLSPEVRKTSQWVSPANDPQLQDVA